MLIYFCSKQKSPNQSTRGTSGQYRLCPIQISSILLLNAEATIYSCLSQLKEEGRSKHTKDQTECYFKLDNTSQQCKFERKTSVSLPFPRLVDCMTGTSFYYVPVYWNSKAQPLPFSFPHTCLSPPSPIYFMSYSLHHTLCHIHIILIHIFQLVGTHSTTTSCFILS